MDKKKSNYYQTYTMIVGLILFLFSGIVEAGSAIAVKDTVFSLPPDSQYREYYRYQAEVMLPAPGFWQVVRTDAPGKIREIYLVPEQPLGMVQPGSRMSAVLDKEQTKKGQYFLQSLHRPCSEYAKQHNGTGPTSWEDFDSKKYGYLIKNLSRSPWGKVDGQAVDGPFVFLVPGATFHFDANHHYVSPEKIEVLAWELRPYTDDGKHWVLYTDGTCQHQPIDPQLMKRYRQVIRPVKTGTKDSAVPIPAQHLYTIAAVCQGKPGMPLRVAVENTNSGKTLEIAWDLHNARPAPANKPVDLKKLRLASWFSYARLSQAPVLTAWMSILDQTMARQWRGRGRGRRQETLSAFDILGGRAAVRETLQLQSLHHGGKGDSNRLLALDSLTGVTVKSHPFREMLEKSRHRPPEGVLPLASLVPHDRLMVYMANPRDILGFLDRGCEYLDRLGTSFTGNGLDYGLDKKYLQRLGLNRQLLTRLFQLGSVTECALICPDLFFIDGTDLTVISRLKKPAMLSSLLQLLGLRQLPQKQILRQQRDDENTVYWCQWDDLLMIGTSKSELERVLQLKTGGGKGSLGQSDEFRYMLTQLPVTASTWSYVYLSAPFIRRLVSPAVKIGQLRRIQARADMEFLTAAALLAQLDGLKSPWSVKDLAANRYIPAHYLEEDYEFDQNHILYSRTYGKLANLKPLSRVPIQRVTPEEKKAYERYVEIYSDYWRKYFDPIALRLDEREDGFLEAEIFILPLVDNTIYNSIKEILKNKEDNTPLKIPKLSENPVLLLSLNLEEPAWQGILKDGYRFLKRYIPVAAGIFDDFGPGLHLAIHDADPVIALGSGDILGLFNTNLVGGPGRLAGGMFSFPIMLSILTRPCSLIIETRNPQQTLGYLKQAAPTAWRSHSREGFEFRVHQVENRDEWVFSFDLLGLMKLRFGVHLQGEFLFLRNIPWSHHERVIAVDRTGMSSAALEVYPETCNLQSPGLFEAHQDRSLLTAFQGIGHLYPLLVSGYSSLEQAPAKYEELFGFTPRHPGKGQFTWDQLRLASSTYGDVSNQRQPAYREGDTNFGLLAGFQYLGVSMQFEDTGFRTKFRWKINR